MVVSLSFAKILENLFLRQLLKFLSKCNIRNNHDQNFQSVKSTNIAINGFYAKVLEKVDMGEYSTDIFINLSKAFDCRKINFRLSKL